jgi:serine/threonine protein kinase
LLQTMSVSTCGSAVDPDVFDIFKDITSGLKYMHKRGCVHRDLKPENGIRRDTLAKSLTCSVIFHAGWVLEVG